MARRNPERKIIRFYKSQTPEIMPWLDAQRDQKLSVTLLIKMAQNIAGNRDLPSILASRGNLFRNSPNQQIPDLQQKMYKPKRKEPRKKSTNSIRHKKSNKQLDSSELDDLTGGKTWD